MVDVKTCTERSMAKSNSHLSNLFAEHESDKSYVRICTSSVISDGRLILFCLNL